MRQILDLHIHSKYSRACSPQLTLKNIDSTCRTKGVDIVATGDFTFPDWFMSIKEELEEVDQSGLYRLKSSKDEKIKFILSTEFALIYKDNDKVRRIHIVLHAPNLKAVEELNSCLDKKYNIRSDGRPILGIKTPDLVKLSLSIHPKFLVYPAHAWTPWFSVFGSKSGFNSLEECFGEQAENIYALETGLSSDPEMNWRLSALDKLTIISNSDAHSLANIGREANVMELDQITYEEIYNILEKKETKKIKFTIEFYPEEGMYHYDGHRDCGIRFKPEETKAHKGICPKCKKSLTVGVMSRVEELADRKQGFRPVNSPGFVKLVELDKIIAEAISIKTRNSKRVQREYNNLIVKLGSELEILLNIKINKIREASTSEIAEGVKRVRRGQLKIDAGFDGQYGTVNIFNGNKNDEFQAKLF